MYQRKSACVCELYVKYTDKDISVLLVTPGVTGLPNVFPRCTTRHTKFQALFESLYGLRMYSFSDKVVWRVYSNSMIAWKRFISLFIDTTTLPCHHGVAIPV